MTKKPKLVYSIKGKLVSAVCMLLVAMIMVVSSTYAWFTLSTAPEVTGISTAVGANGALEMALMPTTGGVSAIGNYTGSGTGIDINRTWGNLVDLSDTSYGLNEITLNPSRLNQTGNQFSVDTPLQTPVYGSDGRLAELKDNTVVGTYSAAADAFVEDDNLGVRAVGVASGMTPRQITYRSALAAASTAMMKARDLASQSLSTNGGKLASIVVKYSSDANATYTQEEIAPLKSMVTDLTAALAYIDEAYTNYLLALAAGATGQTGNVEDTVIATMAGQIGLEEDPWRLDDMSTYIAMIPSGSIIATAIDKFEDTETSVTTAGTELDALTGDVKWTQLSAPLDKLANSSAMKINGFTAKEIMTTEGKNHLFQTVGGGINVSIATGGGVFADIADHCGDYNSNIVIDHLEYGGLALDNVAATMSTASTVTPTYSTQVNSAVGALGSPAGSGDATNPISEYYGYIVDMAFRTNAADSKLLLQTSPVDRYSSDSTTDATMGHGSTMTFTSQSTSYSATQMKELMAALRVVFFETDEEEGTATILATAKLDTSVTGTSTTNGLDTVTANLYLCAADGSFITTQSEAVIKALTQNQAQMVSVLVYLDGDSVENSDVAAEVASSMTGTMNLQFSSSATLVPMDYTFTDTNTPESGEDDEEYTVTATDIVSGVTVNAAATATEGQDYTFTVADLGTNVVTVTVGGQAITTPTPTAEGVYTIPAASVTGDIVITVTAPAAG